MALIVGPLVFILWAWDRGGGLPYFMDGNETFLSYTHARNLLRYSPRDTWLLTVEDTAQPARPGLVYTHNPNLPRYAHALLLLAGFESLTLQVLLITAPLTVLSMLAVIQLGRRLAPADGLLWVTLAGAFALDSTGFLTWAGNSYRTFSFLLFWGTLWATVGPSRGGVIAVLTFALWQYEYGFALFVSASALTLACLLHGRRALPVVTWGLVGAALSALVFAIQVIGHLGWAGFVADLGATLARRGGGATLLAVLVRLQTVLVEQYGTLLLALLLWSALTSVVVVARSYVWRPVPSDDGVSAARLNLARLQVSLLVGLVAFATLLRGYFMDGILGSGMPCLGFLVAVAVATVALDLRWVGRRLIGAVWRGRDQWLTIGLSVTVAAVALAPCAWNYPRIFSAYPQLRGDVVRTLQEKYQSQPFLAGVGFHPLAAALTGGKALPSDLIVSDADLERGAAIRSPDGRLFYLCVSRFWRGSECSTIAPQLQAKGHIIREQGADYAVMELRP